MSEENMYVPDSRRTTGLFRRLVGRTSSLIVSVMVMLLLIVGMWIGWQGMSADLAIAKVDVVLGGWDDAGEVASLEEWQSAVDQVERARSFQDNPEYLHMLALLNEWRMYVADAPVSEDDIELDVEFHSAAVDAYQEALYMRPAWPETWAQIARLKAYLGQFDDTFYDSLHQALVTGQWERRVQILMIDIAGLAWPWMDEDSQVRDELLGNVQATLGYSRASNAGAAMRLLRDYGMLGLICPEMDLNLVAEPVQRVCEAGLQAEALQTESSIQ